MVKAKKFIYENRFVGEPKLTDFKLEEEELPALKQNGTQENILTRILSNQTEHLSKSLNYFSEYLAESIYHSVDPYMISYLNKMTTGGTMIGGTIAKYVYKNF